MKSEVIIDKVLDKLKKHSRVFGYHYMPDREVIIDNKKAEEFMALIDKSIEDETDYLPERYNIDVEKLKEPAYEIIYD